MLYLFNKAELHAFEFLSVISLWKKITEEKKKKKRKKTRLRVTHPNQALIIVYIYRCTVSTALCNMTFISIQSCINFWPRSYRGRESQTTL